DLPACELIAQFHRGCERGSAGAFGEIVRRAKSEANAGGELVLAELDDVVELWFENAEGEIERDARGHSFGERVGFLADDARVRFPRSREGIPFCACTPMTFARLPSAVRTIEQPHAPLPPPIGTTMTSTSGNCSKSSSA